MTVAERLDRKRKDRGWSIRKFHKEISAEAPDIRGASYMSVLAYVTGKVEEPPTAFLRAAAKVLGVRFEWLAYESGWPTEAETPAMDAAAKRAPVDFFARMERDIKEGFGPNVSVSTAAQIALETLHIAVATFPDDKRRGVDRQTVAEALVMPLNLMDFNAHDMPPAAFEHYVITVAEALRYLISETGKE